ncbi:MAG: GNAT family N-acetyltransferase [Gammaproteobacteria bacterium]|nr:GNAT family N-acetyltransferase [Gammaproteobacteria bacterium]MDE2345571.1 GNAT family N-acetyltransferase [Gammaproteobacteria bacterium]
MLEEQRLDSKRHHCTDFDCGTPVLNEYLARYASRHRKRGVTQIYVLVDTEAPSVVLGYYTLSATEVDTSQLTEAERKKLPRFPIPCFRMGRLAVSKDQQGKHLGEKLIGLAVDRCLHAREDVAAYALLVDAKDGRAKAFYEHFGFIACPDQPMALYLPLGQ